MTTDAPPVAPEAPTGTPTPPQPSTGDSGGQGAPAAAPGPPPLTPLQERMASMHHTVVSFGPRWTTQAVENVPIIARHPTVEALDGAFKDKPCVIVAPGPSLDSNIELLREAQGKAVIVAYARVLEKLVGLDPPIYPDIVVVLDPLDLSFQWRGVDASRIGALVPGVSCHPFLYHMGVPRLFTFSGNPDVEVWLHEVLGAERMFLNTSCGVATSTASLVLRMQCNPVIWMGQDLSFPKGRMYAKGTPDGEGVLGEPEGPDDTKVPVHGMSEHAHRLTDTGQALLTTVPRLVRVPGYYGGQVRTQPAFSWTRDWLIDAMAQHPEIDFYNATEGGCHLKGAKHWPMRRVLDKLLADAPDLDVQAILEQHHAAHDPGPNRAALLARCQKLHKETVAAERAARMYKADLLHGRGRRSHMEYHRRAREFDTWITRLSKGPCSLFLALCQVAEADALYLHMMRAKTMKELYTVALGNTEVVQRAAFHVMLRLRSSIAQMMGKEEDYHAPHRTT